VAYFDQLLIADALDSTTINITPNQMPCRELQSVDVDFTTYFQTRMGTHPKNWPLSVITQCF